MTKGQTILSILLWAIPLTSGFLAWSEYKFSANADQHQSIKDGMRLEIQEIAEPIKNSANLYTDNKIEIVNKDIASIKEDMQEVKSDLKSLMRAFNIPSSTDYNEKVQ